MTAARSGALQWEYACRAGHPGQYSGTGNLGDMGWYSNSSRGTTHPVGQKMPNQFGLYDMHGNVLEWCEDVYHREFYSKPEAMRNDPVCTSGTPFRVLRGGSRHRPFVECRSASRHQTDPSHRNPEVGFRPAAPSP